MPRLIVGRLAAKQQREQKRAEMQAKKDAEVAAQDRTFHCKACNRPFLTKHHRDKHELKIGGVRDCVMKLRGPKGHKRLQASVIQPLSGVAAQAALAAEEGAKEADAEGTISENNARQPKD